MFLRPQHFQAQDRYVDSQIRARVDGVRPWPWGFTRLVIDEDLAALGKFRIARASGVMPDGTPFAIPEDIPPPDPIDVPDDARDAIVWLTLPARQPGAVEFRDRGGPREDARFLVDDGEVLDSFAEEPGSEPIEFGRPNLRFGLTRDDIYGRVTLGVARIRELQNKRLIFDDRFIPPALDIRATRLRGAVADILGRADQRAKELAINAVESASDGAETFVSFLLLQALNRWVPVLRHLDALPLVHPERLYEAFASMAGELATLIRPDRIAPPAPPYDHEDPQSCFDPLIDLLQSMLAAVFERSAVLIPLENAGPGAYVATIRDHQMFRTGYFFLAVSATSQVEEIRSLFPSVAKIGATHRMRAIVDSALPGVPLRHVPTAPPQIRALPGYVYFELDRGVPAWGEFATASGLGLHVAGDWPQLKLELWCVKRNER